MRNFFARHTEFVGNVAILMSGKTTAALIALFTMPIVSRLFTPDDFGVAAMFASIIGIASNGASLRYEAAVALPKEEAEAITLMAVAYRILFFVCFTLLFLIAAYEISGINWSAFDSLGVWVWFLPLGVLLMSAIHIQESWLTRTGSFKIASTSLVVGNSITSGTRIGLGALFGSSVSSLVIGNLLGFSSQLAVQKSASREGIRAAFGRIGWSAMRDIAHRYADFPKYNALAGMVFAIGQNLPVLLFGVMFSPVVAGFYAMANRLFQVPVSIVATSMRRVFLQKATAIHNRGGSLRKAFLLSTGGLALLGAPPFACLWLFGQPLLTWLLGESWSVAGQYLEIMAPWLFSVWVAAPSNSVFVVLREQRFFLYRQSGLTALRLGAFGLAYGLSAGPEWTLQAFGTVTVVTNLLTILSTLLMIARKSKSEP